MTEQDAEEEKTEQFNVTFVLGTAIVGVGLIMPEGTGDKLEGEESEEQIAIMVQAATDSLSDQYGWDMASYDVQDVVVESTSF